MTKDDVIKEFTKIQGVGQAKAELLYKNGFTTLNKLKNASIEAVSYTHLTLPTN